MRNRNSRAFLAVAVMLAMVSIGCADAYKACAKATDDVAYSVDQAIQGTKTLYTAGIIDRQEKNAVASALSDLTAANMEFRNNVKAFHSRGASKAEYITLANGFVTSARNLLNAGALHIKDPAAKAKLDNYFLAISAGLDALDTAIQSASGN